ncbi:hypothetical protein E1B28_003722 [Marasmius oreades]|uniref:Rho-GAP domain-containing protein n=1 Tax=Marasmius oreades TaxID=181124 RepID=A0A9P7UX43_9AGAR|nr:uncharacterized protein E1B28_003722 [Marasmius oreades]KAG7096274.1 hypothetical protein E1B28_003722 [Marasmius oreades]
MPSYNSLSLHQRLAALSTASSSPITHYDQSLKSPITPRRSFFHAPWSRRQTESDHKEIGIVQEAMSKLIFQAGVDFETRPMVVVNASALPDPRQVNYDILLSRVLLYLDLYVESDYTVVFFAAGGSHSPGWNWVWKAYRSLSRKYRKNLKRLYVVHSTFFSKMLFSLAGAVISPKFFRKITYISNLSELAYHIPLTQIDIPPTVYSENLKCESTITLPTPIPSSIFGVPLEDIMGYQGEKGGVPRVVKDAVAFIRETGMEEEGIFRRSPSSTMLRAAREAYDRGNVVSLENFADPHLAAVLLKKYLRDLPEPIFPEALYPTIRRCPPPTDPTDMAAVMYVRDVLLPELPPCAYILLSCVLQLLHEISLHSSSNRMDAYNLAVVISPNLVKSNNPARDVMMCMPQGAPALFDGHSPPSPPMDSPGSHSPQTPTPRSRSQTPTSAASLADPRTPVVSVTSSTPDTSPRPPDVNTNTTTLGTIIKLCIQRYYEVFDEVRDPTEATAVTALPPHTEEAEFVGDAGKGTIGRGFGFGMDIELSGSEGEGESDDGGVEVKDGNNLLGFRFGDGGSGTGTGTGTVKGRNWNWNLNTRTGGAAGAGAGATTTGTVSRAFRKLSSGGLLPGVGVDYNFDTDEVLFAKLQHHRRQSSGRHSMRSTGTTDDEEIDDAMLIMPLGPPSPRQSPTSAFPSPVPHSPNHISSPTSPSSPARPPSSWENHKYNYTTVGSNYATYKSKSRVQRAANPYAPSTSQSHSYPTSTPSSIHSGSGGGGFSYAGKARSVISIEKGGGSAFGGTIGKGSISVGRGTMKGGTTTRKSVGAGVEAVGITAEGFFTPPPPVPPSPSGVGVEKEEEEEEGVGDGRARSEDDSVDTPTAEVPPSA